MILCLCFTALLMFRADAQQTPPTSSDPNSAQIQQLKKEMQAFLQQLAPLREQVRALRQKMRPIEEKLRVAREKLRALHGEHPQHQGLMGQGQGQPPSEPTTK